jgi:hypothetical protein
MRTDPNSEPKRVAVAFALNLHSVRDIPAQRSIESCKAPSVRSLVDAGPDVRNEKGHVAVTTNPVVRGYDSCTGCAPRSILALAGFNSGTDSVASGARPEPIEPDRSAWEFYY